MKRVLRLAGFGLAGVAVAVSFAAAGAFAASEAMIRWPVAKPASALVATRDPAAIERGRRVATLNGCHQCHGDKLQGQLFHDDKILKAWAPNLTRLADRPDADLDRAIRHGVGADGRRLWIMPSSAFASLTDGETADLIAYIRTFPAQGEVQPRFKLSPLARAGVLMGEFKSEPDAIVASASLALDDPGPDYVKGRELARACVECHGPQLKGGGFVGSPDLTLVGAYSPEHFERLLRTGVAADGVKHPGLMSSSAPGRFNVWTSQEIGALHEYLKARAARVVAASETLPKP